MAQGERAALAYIIQKMFLKLMTLASKALQPSWGSHGKIARARTAVSEHGPGLWLTFKHNPYPPSTITTLGKLHKLIMTIANLKGGVGKSTLTANLAAYFANPFNDKSRAAWRVLVVDLDFQGSCSSMLFGDTPWRPGEEQLSPASELISGSFRLLGQVGLPVQGVNRARGVAAFYDLARIENREMIRWLIGDEKEDIRYRLSHALLSDAVLENFDVILIDAPPRLTTATVQALCASTHVLIPTVLDPLSADDPVGYFGRQLKAHEWLWPQLKVMGVAGSITNALQRAQEEPTLRSAGDRLTSALQGSSGRLCYLENRGTTFAFPYERSIFKSSPMARAAALGIPYVTVGDDATGRAVRAMFDRFGQEVERRWHL